MWSPKELKAASVKGYKSSQKNIKTFGIFLQKKVFLLTSVTKKQYNKKVKFSKFQHRNTGRLRNLRKIWRDNSVQECFNISKFISWKCFLVCYCYHLELFNDIVSPFACNNCIVQSVSVRFHLTLAILRI